MSKVTNPFLQEAALSLDSSDIFLKKFSFPALPSRRVWICRVSRYDLFSYQTLLELSIKSIGMSKASYRRNQLIDCGMKATLLNQNAPMMRTETNQHTPSHRLSVY
jgi:hypothetical protein